MLNQRSFKKKKTCNDKTQEWNWKSRDHKTAKNIQANTDENAPKKCFEMKRSKNCQEKKWIEANCTCAPQSPSIAWNTIALPSINGQCGTELHNSLKLKRLSKYKFTTNIFYNSNTQINMSIWIYNWTKISPRSLNFSFVFKTRAKILRF